MMVSFCAIRLELEENSKEVDIEFNTNRSIEVIKDSSQWGLVPCGVWACDPGLGDGVHLVGGPKLSPLVIFFTFWLFSAQRKLLHKFQLFLSWGFGFCVSG